MKKSIKIVSIVFASLLTAIMIFLGVYYLWPWNKEFFDKADKEFLIPGLDTTFVPQGMTKLDYNNQYLISGYMGDGSPSRYYLYDSEEEKLVKYFTLKVDNEFYYGHAGGVANAGSTFWTVGDKQCLRFNLTQITEVEDGGFIKVLDSFNTTNGADFVFTTNGMLWIGEFYKEGKYETDRSHHLETTSGETNHALVYGYEIHEGKKYGLLNVTPTKLLSIRDMVQGIAVDTSGNFIMSTSYSLPDSNIYYYKNVLEHECDTHIYLGNNSIPLWFLDNNSLLSAINAPSMAEEIVFENNRVYILFESNAKKYRLFNRKRIKNVYSLPITEFDK